MKKINSVEFATNTVPVNAGPANAAILNVSRKRGHPVGQSDDLSEDEIQRLLNLPDKRKKDELRDYAVLLVFANTPMRKSELVSLNVSNLIDEGKNQYITYVGLKKRSKRKYWLKIPIARNVYEGILRYVRTEYKGTKIGHEEPLFLTLGKHGPYKKQRITPRAIDKIVCKYKKKAGITKRLTPHSFRATYVTQRAGQFDPGTLISLTGHADLKGISPYFRSSVKKRQEAALVRQYL